MANVNAKVTADSSGFQKAMREAVQSMRELSSEYSLASTSAKLFGTAQEALKAKAEELKAKISAQSDIVKLNEKQQESLSKELQKHKDEQAKLQKQIAQTEYALEESTKTTGKNSEETKLLKAELKALKSEEKDAAQSVAMTEEKLSKQTVTTNKSKESLEKLKSELQKTNKELKEAKWSEFAQNAEKATKVLDDVGKKMMVITGAVAGVGTAAIKTTAEFDSQMSTVKSISGATGDQFDALRSKAIEMGSTTAFSASEAGQAMEYMAMAGWTTQDMLDGISGVMSAAAASGEDLAATSDILTDGLTAFGMTAKDSSHFADVLVKAGNSANTSVSMMGETFKYAGAVCGTLGISIEDAAIATGLMGNAGIKASQAGTALRSGLTNLVKPSKDAATAMQQYGVEVATTENGSVDFMATMKNLRETLGGLESTEQAAAIAAIFGKDAMSGWAAIVNASEGDFDSLTDAIYNCEGAAQEAADIKLDNLYGQITILKSTLEGIAIQIGDILMPTVRKIVDVVQEWATKFSELDDASKKQIVTIAGIVAAIGPMLLGFSGVLKTVLKAKEYMTGLSSVIKAVHGAFGLLTSPIGLVVAAIAALTAAFVYLWQTNEGFRDAITAIWEQIKATVGGLIDGIRERMGGLQEAFANIATFCGIIWQGLCDLLAPLFTGAFQEIADILSAASGVILGLLDVFTGVFTLNWSQAGEGLKGIWDAVWGLVGDTLENKLGMLKGLADAFLGWFGTSWDGLWSSVGSFFTSTWNGIKSTATNAWNGIKSAASTAWTAIKAAIMTPINAAKSAVTSAINGIRSAASTAWNAVKSATSSTWNAIKSAIETPINAAKSAVRNAIDAIKSAFNFSWSLPHLKLPHLSISGKFSINPPSVPHFGISWYKTGGIMMDPTIFGFAGTKAMAGGEAGPEAILPLRPFYERLNAVLDEKLGKYLEATESVVYVYCYIDGDQVAARTTVRVSKALANEARRAR